MKTSKDFLVKKLTAKKTIEVYVEVYKSEYRDDAQKGKFYAHLYEIDGYGCTTNFMNTDDYDSIELLKKGIKQEYKETDGENVKLRF